MEAIHTRSPHYPGTKLSVQVIGSPPVYLRDDVVIDIRNEDDVMHSSSDRESQLGSKSE